MRSLSHYRSHLPGQLQLRCGCGCQLSDQIWILDLLSVFLSFLGALYHLLSRLGFKVFHLLSKFLEPRVLTEKPAETFFRKPFMTAIFYKAVIKLVDPISTSLDYLLNSSTLETHVAIFLVFIVATIIYGVAYVLIKLQPPDTEYCPIFRFICLVFGIIAIELLVSTIISPFWLFIVNLCPILIVGVVCSYKQIYQLLCYTAILVFNAVPSLFEKVYHLVHLTSSYRYIPISNFQAISSREREDNDNEGLEMV